MTNLIIHLISRRLSTVFHLEKFPGWHCDIMGGGSSSYLSESMNQPEEAALWMTALHPSPQKMKSTPNHLSFWGTRKPPSSYLDPLSHFAFCLSLAFSAPTPRSHHPLGSLKFWLRLCGVINGGGPDTRWGQHAEHLYVSDKYSSVHPPTHFPPLQL